MYSTYPQSVPVAILFSTVFQALHNNQVRGGNAVANYISERAHPRAPRSCTCHKEIAGLWLLDDVDFNYKVCPALAWLQSNRPAPGPVIKHLTSTTQLNSAPSSDQRGGICSSQGLLGMCSITWAYPLSFLRPLAHWAFSPGAWGSGV